MHKTENKSLWKDEMSYGSDAWYMGRIYEELKKYTWLHVVNWSLKYGGVVSWFTFFSCV